MAPFDPAPDADEAALRAILAAQQDAWNRGDGRAFAAAFAEDGDFTNIRGESMHGREAYAVRHEQIFRGVFRDSTLAMQVAGIRFLGADVAVVQLDVQVASPNGLPPGVRVAGDGRLHTRLMDVFAKADGTWRLVASQNVDLKGPPAPAQSRE